MKLQIIVQSHNHERTLQHKFFKEILIHMQNAEEVHLTGTGTSQEQLMDLCFLQVYH